MRNTGDILHGNIYITLGPPRFKLAVIWSNRSIFSFFQTVKADGMQRTSLVPSQGTPRKMPVPGSSHFLSRFGGALGRRRLFIFLRVVPFDPQKLSGMKKGCPPSFVRSTLYFWAWQWLTWVLVSFWAVPYSAIQWFRVSQPFGFGLHLPSQHVCSLAGSKPAFWLRTTEELGWLLIMAHTGSSQVLANAAVIATSFKHIPEPQRVALLRGSLPASNGQCDNAPGVAAMPLRFGDIAMNRKTGAVVPPWRSPLGIVFSHPPILTSSHPPILSSPPTWPDISSV